MKRGCLLALAIPVVAVAALLAAYPLHYPTYVVRYRLTVNAVVGEQSHSGSTVIEVRVKRQPQLVADMPPLRFSITGEATFVDLGDGRNLVAGLSPGPSRGSDAVGVLSRAFNLPFAADNVFQLKNLRGERRLGPADWPAFVTFRNVSDPLSVEPVDSSALGSAFGVSARIESVTLAVTEAPVTHDLEQHLPWLSAPLSSQEMLVLARRQFSRGEFIRNDP
jgi:hypothetical protein